jgi:2,4-dienoyl-CoA reductase-like NADH-dependent reductase (Old Yellow Enzyme family)
MSSALFSEFKLRDLTLKNRTVLSPMCQYNSDNGSPNDWHLMHYGTMSMGGLGLVMAEMTNVSPEGRISPKCSGLYSKENEDGWKRVVDFCKKYGVAPMGVQLAHAGRKASVQPPALGGKPITVSEGGWETVGPSAIAFGDAPAPRAATRDDLAKIKADHVASVEASERIGFDVIEMHAGHGYLMHQFMSPLSNQRTDEYGGSLENRIRFVLEVFAAMRAKWPASKPMGARVSATDWVDGGWTPEETVVLVKELQKLGCDYVDVTTAGLDPRQQIPLSAAYQAPFAEKVKKETGIATMSVGLIDGAKLAEDVIASGKADFVVLGRGALYDPRWAWHAAYELGAETPYAPKYMMANPKIRPQLFPAKS